MSSQLGETFWRDRSTKCRCGMIEARIVVLTAIRMMDVGRTDAAKRFLVIEGRKLSAALDALELEDAQKLAQCAAEVRAANGGRV